MTFLELASVCIGIIVFLAAVEILGKTLTTPFKRILQGFILIIGIAALVAVAGMPG